MKTCFKISGSLSIKPELAKEIVRFCIAESKPVAAKINKPLPRNMAFKIVRAAYGSRSGRATRNTGRINSSRVYLRIADSVAPHFEVYHRYKHRSDCPKYWIEDSLEMFVHLTAHEIGHAICGFDGDMTGEYQCERHAAKVVENWRAIYRPIDCMI